MYVTKRNLKNEIVHLSYRIKDLEERLCPCESHSWKQTGYHFEGGTGMGDEDTINHYKCRVCGKEIETRHLLKEDG